jgi:hypothetical protein
MHKFNCLKKKKKPKFQIELAFFQYRLPTKPKQFNVVYES